MNPIKALLNKYLCKDAIFICELSEKAGDLVWLEEQGYYDRKTGEETAKGKAYTKKHNKLLEQHFEKIRDNSLDNNNLCKLREAMINYVNSNPDVDIYEGMSEAEIFAFRYVYRQHS